MGFGGIFLYSPPFLRRVVYDDGCRTSLLVTVEVMCEARLGREGAVANPASNVVRIVLSLASHVALQFLVCREVLLTELALEQLVLHVLPCVTHQLRPGLELYIAHGAGIGRVAAPRRLNQELRGARDRQVNRVPVRPSCKEQKINELTIHRPFIPTPRPPTCALSLGEVNVHR